MKMAAAAAAANAVSFRIPFLAWSYSPEDEKRFRRSEQAP